MSETTTTTATYDQIAADYAARWKLAEVMAPTRERFAAHLPAGAQVLDAGCGPAHDTAALRALGLRAFGLDRSRGMLAQGSDRNVPLVLGDMRSLPVPDASLDGVWACASFLHIPKRDAPVVLRAFRRALRADGIVYIGVKQGHGERWVEHQSGAPNLRRFFAFYQATELDALVESAGFSLLKSWLDVDTLGREPWLGRILTLNDDKMTR